MSILKRKIKRTARVAGITLGDMSGTIVMFSVTFAALLIRTVIYSKTSKNPPGNYQPCFIISDATMDTC